MSENYALATKSTVVTTATGIPPKEEEVLMKLDCDIGGFIQMCGELELDVIFNMVADMVLTDLKQSPSGDKESLI